MATKVHMEALSPTMEEGQVVKWLKSEGDAVSNGEILAEVETDKATMELTARGEGVLRKILLDEGGTAPVGQVIAVIAGEDEDIEGLELDGAEEAPAESGSEAEPTEAETSEGPKAADAEGTAASPEPEDAEDAPDGGAPAGTAASPGDGRIKVSPLARRLAEEQGLDLGRLQGSGPGGRIVKRDIEVAIEEGVAAAAPAGVAGPEHEDVPLSQMRKAIAKRLVQSIGPVPHFFLTMDVDMSRATDARGRINEALGDDGPRISFNDMILKATAAALARHPECNAHWGEDHVRRFNRVHLGVAVAIDDGLITPVVRDAQAKGVAEISREVRELAGRAREKKLQPEEYTGATFSVSNLGMFGIEEFTAVINPPEAGILAVGAVEERPVAEDGQVVVRPRMKMTMSCDHRVIDGAQGSRFLRTLKGILEEPFLALV